jgi:hypothetical protein
MIPIEKLKAVKTIFVHDTCSDGLMSALLLKDAYTAIGMRPEIRFLQYLTDETKTLEPGPGMLFCDFSPHIRTVKDSSGAFQVDEADRSLLQHWVDSGTIVLDHHKGAKAIVKAFGENGVYGDEEKQPGVSGATLAFSEVWCHLLEISEHEISLPASQNPFHQESCGNRVDIAYRLAHLAGIRDTWQNKSSLWRDALILNEVLLFYPDADWLERNQLFSSPSRDFWAERFKMGELLLTKHEKGIKKCIEKAWLFTTVKGTRVVVFEGVRSASDTAEVIDTDADLVIAFDYEVETFKDGTRSKKINFSTRSHTTFNCLDFAKANGGGGHMKAAGFAKNFDSNTPAPYSLNPYALAEALVELHENSSNT